MEDKKETGLKEKNTLENGTYSIYGPENGDITFDTLELHAGSGAKRVWKVEEFSREKIVLKVLKFG
jgi:hypothetical protein